MKAKILGFLTFVGNDTLAGCIHSTDTIVGCIHRNGTIVDCIIAMTGTSKVGRSS